MIALLFSSILSLYLFVIGGIFISKIVGLNTNITEKILVGLALTNTFTAILSVFFPIDIYILIALFVCYSITTIFITKEIKSLIFSLQNKKVVILYALPFIFIALFISLGSPQLHDAGLYHIQSIKWIEAYPAVPGLANLHGRFGFNPNIFIVFALSSLFEIFNQETFSINFTFFSVFTFYYINQLYIIFKKHGIINLFIFNLVIFLTILNFSSNLTEPTPDFISLTLTLFILSRLFNNAVLKQEPDLKGYLPIIILCIYVITVKLAIVPILILPLIVFLKFRFEIKKITLIISALAIILLPWIIRNIILTGWLIYPFHSLDFFSFDWEVPKSDLMNMNEAITGWARIPGEQYHAAAHMNLMEWFPFWWDRLVLTNKIELVTALLFPIIALLVCLIRKIKIDLNTLSYLLIPFFGVIFLIMFAPDFRFGKAFIIAGAISPLLFLKFKFTYLKNQYMFFIIILLSAFLFNSFVKKNNGSSILKIIKLNSHQAITQKIITKPKNAQFKTYPINNLNIYTPKEDSEDRCFDHCIPCTPYPDTTVILRNNTWRSGFKHWNARG